MAHQPARPVRQPGKVTANDHITASVMHITIGTAPQVSFKAGQFAWIAKEDAGKVYRRPYSMASAPWEAELAFCVKNVQGGEVSPVLCALEPGEEVDLWMPLGSFVMDRNEEEHIFIATGTGIAPFRSMLRTIYSDHFEGPIGMHKRVTLLCGSRMQENALYDQEWRALAAKEPLFTYLPVLSREQKEGFLHGHVQEHLEKLHICTKAKYYICGLSEMVLDVKEKLIEAGVPHKNIHVELYG